MAGLITVPTTQQGMSVHNSSLPNGVSPFQMTFIPNTVSLGTSPKKRRLEESIDMKENKGQNVGLSGGSSRRFLAVPSNGGVFHTEQWKERQTPLYLPITDNLLINTSHIEQVSFSTGSWFLADASGNYCGSQEGDVVNLWRYDDSERKLYISRSLLFTDAQVFHMVKRQLEDL